MDSARQDGNRLTGVRWGGTEWVAARCWCSDALCTKGRIETSHPLSLFRAALCRRVRLHGRPVVRRQLPAGNRAGMGRHGYGTCGMYQAR